MTSTRLFLVATIMFFAAYQCMAQAPKWQMAISTSGDARETITDIMHDDRGNTIVQGYYDSPGFDFGGGRVEGQLSTKTPRDFFLAKFNRDNELVWTRRLYGLDSMDITLAEKCSVDSLGNIYTCILARGHDSTAAVILGEDTVYMLNPNVGSLVGLTLLVKFDPNGEVLWHHEVTNRSIHYGFISDRAGNCYYVGSFSNGLREIVFGSDTIRNPNPFGISEALIIRFDPEGNYLWSRTGGGKYTEILYDAEVDHRGDLYITGLFSSDTAYFGNHKLVHDFGGGFILPHQNFYAKIDKNGDFQFANKISATPGQSIYVDCMNPNQYHPNGATFISSNSPYDTGSIGSLWLDKGAYVFKLDENGQADWISQLTQNFNVNQISIEDMDTDDSGNVYIAVKFYSDTLILAGDTLYNSGSQTSDVGIVKINGDLSPVRYLHIGGEDAEIVVLGARTDGALYVGGEYASVRLELDSNHILQNSNYPYPEAFLAMYATESLFPTGISELTAAPRIGYYPNPTSSLLHIDLSQFGNNREIVRLQLYDPQGQVCMDRQLTAGLHDLSIGALSPGLYILHVSNDHTSSSVRLIKQ